MRFVLVLLACLVAAGVLGVGVACASVVDECPGLERLTVLVPESEISPMHLAAYRAVTLAMDRLGFECGDSDVLALTDAGFALIADRYSTASALDALVLVSGCSKSNGNLVVVHASKWRPLWFAFYRKGSGECVYIEVDSGVLEQYMEMWMSASDKSSVQESFMSLSDDELFSKVSMENIHYSNLLSNPESWHEKMESKVFGGNEFSIMTIAACWDKGMPYELLQAAELHNHICPGLTSGILIMRYLDEVLPIESSSQYYVILAVPPWCKDDAFQAVYDSTVGKRRMRVMMLSKEQSEQLPPVAGIYVRWDRSEDRGDAVVLTFDWDKACSVCGVERSWFKKFDSYEWWYARLKVDLDLLDYLDKPEEFISVVKEFQVNSSSELNALSTAGVNPYVEIGLMSPPQTSSGGAETPATEVVAVIPEWMYVVIGVLVAAIVVVAAVSAVKVRKAKSSRES